MGALSKIGESKSVRTIAHGESNARNTFEGKRLRTDVGWLDFSVGLNRMLRGFDSCIELLAPQVL